MITDEKWKAVKGRPGYEVSSKGRVRNRKTGEIKAQRKTKNGYMITTLKNGTKTTAYIHRLVAEAFVPNPDSLPHVNHKDEDKTNNNASNLEWCTPAYNNAYGSHIDKIRETKTERYGIPVAKLDRATGERVAVYESARLAADDHNVTRQAILWALKAPNHTAAGFRWEVVEK